MPQASFMSGVVAVLAVWLVLLTDANSWSCYPSIRKCYMHMNERKEFSLAQAHCKSNGGDLASINSKEENDIVAALLPGRAQCYKYAGYDNYNGKALQEAFNTPEGDCCDLCSKIPSCLSYAWNNHKNGTCWFKSATGLSVKTEGVTVGNFIIQDAALIGLQKHSSGKRVWIAENKEAEFVNWLRGEPTNNASELCTTIIKAGQGVWNDVHCDLQGDYKSFVCQKPSVCNPNPCKHGGVCSETCSQTYICACAAGYSGKDCAQPIKECSAWGDPHFTAFDGTYYHPQPPTNGTWLASGQTTNGVISGWAVWFRTSLWGKGPNTCVREVQIEYDGYTVIIGRNGALTVNGVSTTAPWYHPNKCTQDLAIEPWEKNGHKLSIAKEALSVFFNGEDCAAYRFVVHAPVPSASGVLSGFCGTIDKHSNTTKCNDGRGNDLNRCYPYPMKNVTTTTLPPGVTPTTTTTTAAPTCTLEQRKKVDQACLVISDVTGPFAKCIAGAKQLANTYTNSCQFDLCSSQQTDYSVVICEYLASYAAACADALGASIHWRSANLCPPTCSAANTEYSECASRCPATCGNRDASKTCNLPCTGDCQCKANHLLEHGRCIPESQCGCVDRDGNYHKANETWVTDDCTQSCSCHGGQVQCTTLGGCAANAECAAVNGGLTCVCKNGYHGNGRQQCISTTTPTATSTSTSTTATTTTSAAPPAPTSKLTAIPPQPPSIAVSTVSPNPPTPTFAPTCVDLRANCANLTHACLSNRVLRYILIFAKKAESDEKHTATSREKDISDTIVDFLKRDTAVQGQAANKKPCETDWENSVNLALKLAGECQTSNCESPCRNGQPCKRVKSHTRLLITTLCANTCGTCDLVSKHPELVDKALLELNKDFA